MSSLKCPNCGDATAFTPLYFTRNVVFDYVVGTRESARDEGLLPAAMPEYWKGIKYAILCCQSCNDLFVVADLYGSGLRVVYPIPRKTVPEDIPQPIKGEFEEACLCFAVGTYLACLLMCKTVIIALQRQQAVSNLKQLMDKGTISKTLYGQADEVRLWANIIGHEDVLPESVTKEDCEQLLAYVELVLNAVYVEPARFEALKQKREQMGKKPTKK
jgi:hypothetical protein